MHGKMKSRKVLTGSGDSNMTNSLKLFADGMSGLALR